MADILRVVRIGARKTRIMYGANLSFTLANRYIAKLTSLQLIRRCNDDKTFELTQKGDAYLDGYQHLQKIEHELKSTIQRKMAHLEGILQERQT